MVSVYLITIPRYYACTYIVFTVHCYKRTCIVIILHWFFIHFLISLGIRDSAINRAEGLRQSKILASEAFRIQQINEAKGSLHYYSQVVPV